MAEGARLESVFRGNSNVGSNPTLSAIFFNNLETVKPGLGLLGFSVTIAEAHATINSKVDESDDSQRQRPVTRAEAGD